MFSQALFILPQQSGFVTFPSIQDSQMCVVETIPEGRGEQKEVKKVCPVSSEPKELYLSLKVARRKTVETLV